MDDCEGGGEGSDEGVMKVMILRYLWGFVFRLMNR